MTELTPHDLTLPGTTARDKGVWANESIKGCGYYFTNKDGDTSYAKVIKYRKRDFDVEIDGVKFVWPRQKNLLFFFTPEEAADGHREELEEQRVRFLQYFVRDLERGLKAAQTNIMEFAEKLAKSKNPGYEMGWSLSTFQAAANQIVFTEALCLFNAGVTIGNIVSRFTKEVVDRSRSVANRSTSQTSNLMDDATLSAYSAFIDNYKWHVDVK